MTFIVIDTTPYIARPQSKAVHLYSIIAILQGAILMQKDKANSKVEVLETTWEFVHNPGFNSGGFATIFHNPPSRNDDHED